MIIVEVHDPNTVIVRVANPQNVEVVYVDAWGVHTLDVDFFFLFLINSIYNSVSLIYENSHLYYLAVRLFVPSTVYTQFLSASYVW
jgi:hypothetical protein